MDVTFGAEHEAFRSEARAWLAAHVPPEPLPSVATAAGFEAQQAWEAAMFADRWSAVSWPTEYGGRGLGIMEWLVFEEEYDRARAPERVSRDGIFLLGPTLLEVGTMAQKERFLPAIAAGEEIWCQAWSERDHRSDLPVQRAHAVRDAGGRGWRLSGQNAWTTGSAFAHWCFGVFRTDPDAEPDGALTCFLIPMGSPGITVQPLRRKDGDPGPAEIVFDGVAVPDGQVLGTEGSGSSVALSIAASERGLSLRSPARAADAAARLIHLFDQRGAPAPAADAVARAYIDAQACQLHTYWTASKVARGQPVGPEASCNEIFRSELDVVVQETALALLGSDAELLEAGSPGEWLEGTLSALAGRADDWTNEMRRNLVAERLLGLGEG